MVAHFARFGTSALVCSVFFFCLFFVVFVFFGFVFFWFLCFFWFWNTQFVMFCYIVLYVHILVVLMSDESDIYFWGLYSRIPLFPSFPCRKINKMFIAVVALKTIASVLCCVMCCSVLLCCVMLCYVFCYVMLCCVMSCSRIALFAFIYHLRKSILREFVLRKYTGSSLFPGFKCAWVIFQVYCLLPGMTTS